MGAMVLVLVLVLVLVRRRGRKFLLHAHLKRKSMQFALRL
jgi:hypothetical protein